jgi:hypothetical protein
MDNDIFEARLRELEALQGQDMGMELFNEEYEETLREIQTGPGPRFKMLERMNRVLRRQVSYVTTCWIREKAIDKIKETMSSKVTSTVQRIN